MMKMKRCSRFTLAAAALGLVFIWSLKSVVELTKNSGNMVKWIMPIGNLTSLVQKMQHSTEIAVEDIQWNKSLRYSADRLPTPPEYNPQFKSPCWYESRSLQESHILHNGYVQIWDNWDKSLGPLLRKQLHKNNKDKVLQCLPYFYLIGINKAGTTDLQNWLKKHPQMSSGAVKEPTWWNVLRFGYAIGHPNVLYPPVPFRDYVGLFDGAATQVESHPQNVVYEASARTFWNNDMWPLDHGNDMTALEPKFTTAYYMKSMYPAVKLALVLRNPTTRLYSQYIYLYKETNKSPEHFHGQVVSAVSKMKQCIAVFGDRACAYSIKLNRPLETSFVFLRSGMYSIYLKDWLDVFGREQMFIFRFEDYVINRKKTLNNIFNFLELDPMPSKYDKELRGEEHKNDRSAVYNKTGGMLPETVNILDDFYKPYKQGVADLLNNNDYLWL